MDARTDRWTGGKGEKERNEESKDLTYRIEFNALFLHEITIRVPQLLENDRLREREKNKDECMYEYTVPIHRWMDGWMNKRWENGWLAG